MRETQYTASVLLEGAYELAIRHGVSNLSARAVAREIGISTQPIYLVFKNMNGLRVAMTNQIFLRVKRMWFSQNSSLSEYIGNVANFIKNDSTVYFSLVTDRETFNKMQKFLYELFVDAIADDRSLNKDEAPLIYSHIVGTLTACMGMDDEPTEEKLVDSISDYVQTNYSCQSKELV
ncbi:hypothetical protein BAU15_05635 [Enterococcus sp. JM4C]|uniref:TetR/AcrR family transcriptional regulator n=1 Tax=Candidatus Enterococcus huntleyi TaxID=1857217 RepID=UPI00137A6F38|nr:TetR family transcriptional regulator [Enterococcus sp. JM4C]KAF1295230.1 hypothetical protein BAU15_05635 [Enterococcus sp. JM4C]